MTVPCLCERSSSSRAFLVFVSIPYLHDWTSSLWLLILFKTDLSLHECSSSSSLSLNFMTGPWRCACSSSSWAFLIFMIKHHLQDIVAHFPTNKQLISGKVCVPLWPHFNNTLRQMHLTKLPRLPWETSANHTEIMRTTGFILIQLDILGSLKSPQISWKHRDLRFWKSQRCIIWKIYRNPEETGKKNPISSTNNQKISGELRTTRKRWWLSACAMVRCKEIRSIADFLSGESQTKKDVWEMPSGLRTGLVGSSRSAVTRVFIAPLAPHHQRDRPPPPTGRRSHWDGLSYLSGSEPGGPRQSGSLRLGGLTANSAKAPAHRYAS